MNPLPHPRSPRRAPHPVLGQLAGTVLILTVWCGGAAHSASAQPAKGGSAAAPPVAAAAATSSVPTVAEIEARIKETEAATGLDEAAKTALVESLKRTSTYLDAGRDYAAKASAFTDAITSAPEQTAAIRKQLSATADDDPPPSPRALAALTADDLAGRLLKAQTEATGIEGRLADLDKGLEDSGSRPAEIRERLVELRQALDGLATEAARPAPPDQPAEQVQAGAWRLAAQRQALTAELQSLEQELASQGVRDELARAQREQLTLTLTQVKERQRQLQEVQDLRRKADAEQARRETETAQRESADKHPLVQQAAHENTLLTKALGDLAEQLDRFSAQLTQIAGERSRIETDFRGARERIGIAGINQALGMVLIDRRNELPDLRKFRKEIAARNDQIAEATLHQIRYREEQRTLRDLDTAIAALTADHPDAQTDQIRSGVRQLLETRRTLIDKALAGLQDYIGKQGELNDAADQLIQTAEAYDAFLAEHLLWVRNARPISLNTLSALPGAVAWTFSRQGWGEVIEVLRYEFLHSALAWVGLVAVIVLFARQAAIKRAILASAEPLRRVRTDRFVYTLEAIGLTWVAALPLPLACLLLGRELAGSIETTAFTRAVGYALTQVALAFYFLRAFRLTCLPGGVADRHFRWESDVLVKIRQNLRWFTPYILMTSLVAYIIYQSHDIAHAESLGRLTLIAGTMGTAAFLGRLLHPGTGVFARNLSAHPGIWASRLRNLWFPTVVGAPLALGILAAFGYIYTAGTLFQSLVESAWLALALV
ncbi:MAG TPA: mechanosensitive ion channel protein MscS, partial [Lamprocystis sp. (in: g-proteobacteria)]|nr:mechanosensitive ion channel protein MscS [Lamprocystis sp. (in: g-proteobacteria)]